MSMTNKQKRRKSRRDAHNERQRRERALAARDIPPKGGWREKELRARAELKRCTYTARPGAERCPQPKMFLRELCQRHQLMKDLGGAR